MLGLWCAGCAGYHLGPSNGLAAGAQSIQVLPFHNRTPEPRLGETVTHLLRKQLQQDGTYRLSTREPADILVTGSLRKYDRHGVTFERGDVITPRDYTVDVTAHVRAVHRASGRVLLDRDVTGHTTLRVGLDLASAERQALPVLAEDLARNITALLVDGDW